MAKNGCKIQKNNKNGKINGVLNQEGEKSTLFQQIFNTPTLSLDESIDIYKNVYSDKIQNVMFQIIGEKGASKVEQYQQSLNQAKALDKQGAYTSEIEKQTGWYKNQQNQWKKFSDDYVEQLAFKPNYLENINKEVLISDVLEDNIILQAYPEIKNQKVIFYDETYKNIPEQAVGTNGFLRIEERGGVSTLFIKTGEGRGEMDKNTFSHELNHYIQRVEGFAKGGNEQTTILLAMSVGRVRKGYGGIKKQFLDSLKRTDLTKEDRKIIEEGIKYLNSANKDEFAFAQYQRLQGEIDSRAVENAVKFNKLGKTYSEIVDDILRKDSINEEDIINIFGIERLLESRPAQKENNTQEVIDRLKQTGLAENIYQLTTEEINVKLKELSVSEDVRKQVMAYHGSPYSFDRFTTNAMGTGEGAQAFGWGLYFTDLESIAKNYAEVLADSALNNYIEEFDNKLNTKYENFYDIVNNLSEGKFLNESWRKEADKLIKEEIEFYKSEYKDVGISSKEAKENLKLLNELILDINNTPNRNLYKVSLHKGKTPSEYTWLEWDRGSVTEDMLYNIEQSLSKYSDEAISIFREEIYNYENATGESLYTALSNLFKKETSQYVDVNGDLPELMITRGTSENDKDASLILADAGISGIKYPAESLALGATSDTARGFNYVVFDENAITIEEQIQFQKALNNIGINLVTNGFIYDGEVFLNKDTITEETPIHEFSHLLNSWMKTNRPELYNRGVNLAKAELTKENSEIKDVIDYVKTTQPNLTGEALLEEIVAELTGRKGAELLESGKKSGIIDWLKEFWTEIKNMLGILEATPEQVANMTLSDFAKASATQLLKGEDIASKAQTYFTRNADRLPLTLAVFNRPEFKDLQGRMVNPQTVTNYLNQSGIKQIEKDLIKQIIQDNYQGQKKISYDELEATVRANIMPLERITTSSYADYGVDNLGNGNYGQAKTLILNAPIEHGVTGHFSGDFKASGRQNIKYQAKQLDANTWVAVEEGYEANANDNNIYQYVGTAGTKEAVDAWIENYNNIANTALSEDERVERNDLLNRVGNLSAEESSRLNYLGSRAGLSGRGKDINKGMFGHIRVWQDGEVFTVAELQSDTYQKNKAKELFIKQSDINKKAKENVKDRIFNKIVFEKVSKWEYEASIEGVKLRITEQDGEYFPFIDGDVLPDIFDNIEDAKKEIKKGLDFFELESFTKELEKEKIKVEQEFLKNLLPQEKQFIASQKEWEKRMVREAIKEASLSGATSLRFPTPYTLSVIEGYLSEGAPYEIVSADDSTYLVVGDSIYYGREDYIVLDSDGTTITIAESSRVQSAEEQDIINNEIENSVDNDMYEIENNLKDFYTQEEWNDFRDNYSPISSTELDEVGNEIEEGVFEVSEGKIRDIVTEYYNDVFTDANSILSDLGVSDIYQNDTTFYYTDGSANIETLMQPSMYKGEGTKDEFSIEDDLDDTQQTVARKYEEIAEILKKEKPVEVVTDENGFDWYETKITPEEVNKPVIAFQKIIEPSTTFNNFNTYTEAVKNTPINEIIKIDIEGINVGEVTNNGDINDLIRQDIIADQRELSPNGDIVFITKGNSLAKKLVNAEIARETVKGRVNEEGNIIAREKVELTEVSEDFNKNKKEFGEDVAITILGAKILKENTPSFGNNRIIDYSIEIPSDNVLMTKLKNLLQELGIKTMSLETWAENYKRRTGEEPTSNSLADISNKIVAFANGEITQDALTEEVMHFVVEGLNQEEIQPLLDMIHKTDEWKQYAQQYTEIYKDDVVVRKEILGKVLKNRIQGKAEQSTLQGQSITRRLAELINKFFEQVRGLFKPQHQQQLDKFSEEIYQKLMAEELYSELSPEQFDGNKLVMYQAAPDAIYDHLSETISSFERLDRETGRQNKFELSLLDIENRDELHQLRTVAALTALIKTKIKHLTKRGKQEGFLSVEEQEVYDVAINEIEPALGKLKNIVAEKVTGNTLLKQKVLEGATEAITSLSELTTALNEDNKRVFDTLVEDVASQTGLTPEMTDILKAEIRTIQRDTNQFFTLYGSLSQAQNPILNIMSTVTSDTEREATIQFDKRQSLFINEAKAIGFTDEQIASSLQKFKDGYYFISQWDFEAIEKEKANFKVEIYSEITGKKITAEELLKEEIKLIKKLSQKQQTTYNFKVKEKIDKSGMQLDRLTKEERKKADELIIGFSEKTKLFLANQAKRKGEVMQRVRENGGASMEDNSILKDIAKQRQQMSNPYDEDGYLHKGLSVDSEGNIVFSKDFEKLDKDYDKERATTIVELADYNKKIVAQYKKKEALEGKQTVPQSFIDKIQDIRSSGKIEDIEKATNFLRLNTRISYNSNFWDSFEKTSGLVDKLRESSDLKAIGIAETIERERNRLKNILKEHRDYNNPSQIDFENLGGAESIIKDIMSNLEHQYEKAKLYVKDDEIIKKASSSETITNEAYKKVIEDRGLAVADRSTYEEKLDFILRHVTPNNRGKILKNIDKFINYKKGYGTLPKSFERFYNESVSVEEYNKNVGGDIKIYNDVISYAESMLLPYFKELKPVDFNMGEFIASLVSAKTEEEFNKVIEESEYISVTPSYALIDAEDNSRLNPEYTKAYEAGEPTVNLRYTDKNGKEIFKNERYAEMFLDKDGNIRKDKIKEKQLLDLAISFWADSIKSAGLEGKHSKFQLPGIRRSDLARKGQLIKDFSVKNLKESIKDIITVREDDPIFGQAADSNTRGALKVPRIGFSKLETADEVTDEILYSLMHTANQAEKRKQRVASLHKIEAIKTRLKGASYGDKSGEATTAYKMADDNARYNIYGQTENFKWETDFFGLSSKKYNLAPVIKHFQSWTRLVGIGFSTLVPLTSFLQGATNFLVENIVGDRINPTASRLASKKVGQLVSRAVKEEFMSDIKTKSELNLLMQFFGLGNPIDNFKNTNSGRVMRGLALENSAYFSHFMGDVPLTAQTLMTVLYDFKIIEVKNADGVVINKKLQSYSEWRNENRALVITGEKIPATEKQALLEWKENQKYLYNYLEVEKDARGEITGMKMNDEYYKIFAGKEKYATDRLNFVKRKIQTTKQEIDNQIPDGDRAYIQRHAIWSFVSMFKGFLITSVNKRFKMRHDSFHTNEMEEGTYRGTSEFLGALINKGRKGSFKDFWKEQYKEFEGGYKLEQEGNEWVIYDTNKEGIPELMRSEDKAYVKRAHAQLQARATQMRQVSLKRAALDFAITASLATIALLAKQIADDDDDDDYTKEFMAYMTYRLAVETTSQSTGIAGQAYSFIQSPTAGLSQINNLINIGDLGSSEVVSRGTYRGYSEREALLYRSIPVMKEYFRLYEIDRSRQDYKRYNKHFIDNFNVAALMFDEESRK